MPNTPSIWSIGENQVPITVSANWRTYIALFFRDFCSNTSEFLGQACYFSFWVCDDQLESLSDLFLIFVNVYAQRVKVFRLFGGSLGRAGIDIGILYQDGKGNVRYLWSITDSLDTTHLNEVLEFFLHVLQAHTVFI